MKKLIPLILSLTAICAHAQNNRMASLQTCMAPFYHGVASGDPLTDRVIIWTRVTPDSNQVGAPILVSWRISTDTSMSTIITNGSVITDSTKDFTVKADVIGLQPNTFYFYEFSANGYNSVRGRTKTNPVTNADSLRFAVTSCANYEAGYFNTYASLLARNDFDGVFSIGDYIYEYNSGGYSPNATVNRQWLPSNEIISIADYRTRYSSYRLDEDLQRLHQQFPFTVVWDDHEFANDAWMNGAQNHTTANEGSWSARKAVAKKAFFEWQPIRDFGTGEIYRKFSYGNLVDFIMLDTRVHGRDLQAGTTGSTVTSGSRQLLGANQYQWLENTLDSSTAQWKVIGQQVMMAPLRVFGTAVNGDQWDGYPAQRDNLFAHILNNNIDNVVVLTGDIHSSWANDLPTSSYNGSTGAGSAGVEFVTPSVTSPGMSIPLGAAAIMASNSHIKYVDLSQHGYIIVDINQQRTQSDWFYVPSIDVPSIAFNYGGSFYANHLQRFLTTGTAAAVPRNSVYYMQAPLCPRNVSTGISQQNNPNVILGLYPNPVYDYLTVQFNNASAGQVNFKVYDVQGKLASENKEGNKDAGVLKSYVDIRNLSTGVYFLVIETNSGTMKQKFLKD
ncbi:MAG: alkaline phosphatase D family protein [Bacteroidia bacterium]|nr:alkaline phosphatase D family protein [Bacteroidia bacterium]